MQKNINVLFALAIAYASTSELCRFIADAQATSREDESLLTGVTHKDGF
jgi:hypothetical protein